MEQAKGAAAISRRNMMAFSLCYFAFFGGLASLLPHLSLWLRKVGITGSEMAVMGCITPLLGLFTRPLAGALADKFKWHKQLAIICLLGNGLFFSLMLALPVRPPVVQPSALPTYSLTASANGSWNGCAEMQLEKLNSSIACSIPDQMQNCSVTCTGSNDTFFVDSTIGSCIITSASLQFPHSACVFNCSAYYFPWINATASELGPDPASSKCLPPESRTPPKRTYRIEITPNAVFFLWLLVRSIAYSFFHPCFNLQDSMVFSVLGENRALFGRVRSFGSIGFFIFALVTSAIVHASGSQIFWPVVLIYDILMVVAAGSVYCYRIKDAQASRNLFKAIGSAFRNAELSVLLIFITFTGILNTMFEIYIFWYLHELGATALLYGVMLAVNCLFETPCIIFAGRLIARIGEIPCIFLVFGAYAVRFLVYSFIQNPWFCMLVEPLQGITMGIHLVAYTSYVARATEKNSLASMQGLASGMHYGLGGCIGALAGGFTYDALGPRVLYRGCATFALICMIAYIIVHYCCVKRCTKTDVRATEKEVPAKDRPIIIVAEPNGHGRSDSVVGALPDEEELKTLTSQNGNGHADGEKNTEENTA